MVDICATGYDVDCIPPIMPSSWAASPDYDAGWITGLYDTAKESLHSIFGNYDEFYLKDDDLLNFDHLDFNKFVESSSGPIVYLSVWAVVTLLCVILGICWCCCQKCICCCKTSFADKEDDEDYLESDDPHHPLLPYSQRKRGNKSKPRGIILTVLMAIWLAGFLAAIMYAFASNQKAQETLGNINGDIKNAFDDIISYLEATIEQMEYTFIKGFDILKKEVYGILQECGRDCDVPVSKSGQPVISMGLLIDLTRLSTIPPAAESMDILNSNESSEGETTAERVKSMMQTVGDEITNQYSGFKQVIKQVQNASEEVIENVLTDFDNIMKNVYDGAYWGIMLFNLLFVAIFILVLIGTLLATFSGGRPLQNAGYLSYRVAIVIMMIILVFVVTIMLSAFTLAGITSVIICPTVRALEEGPTITPTQPPTITSTQPPTGAPITSAPGETKFDIPSVGTVIRACKNDYSAYNAFQLRKMFNVGEFTKLSQPLQDIIDKLSGSKQMHFEAHLGQQPPTVEDDDDNVTSTTPNDLSGLEPLVMSLTKVKIAVDRYGAFLEEAMRDKVGKCWPLYNAVDSTLNTFCVKVVAPVASLWFILQFIPPIFLAIFFTALAFERSANAYFSK